MDIEALKALPNKLRALGRAEERGSGSRHLSTIDAAMHAGAAHAYLTTADRLDAILAASPPERPALRAQVCGECRQPKDLCSRCDIATECKNSGCSSFDCGGISETTQARAVEAQGGAK